MSKGNASVQVRGLLCLQVGVCGGFSSSSKRDQLATSGVCCLSLPHAQAVVEQQGDGSQVIKLSTMLQAGRLLLHWGVEGGKDYKGGWRLPGAAARPDGTNQYKDRALQSPFK